MDTSTGQGLPAGDFNVRGVGVLRCTPQIRESAPGSALQAGVLQTEVLRGRQSESHF